MKSGLRHSKRENRKISVELTVEKREQQMLSGLERWLRKERYIFLKQVIMITMQSNSNLLNFLILLESR